MIKWLIRLAVLPTTLALYILVWFGMYIVHYSEMLCRLIAGSIFVLVVIGFVTGLGIREHLMTMLAIGFITFLIPRVAGIIVSNIALTLDNLKKKVYF